MSAERRFSAISNETRVRVDASMKRLMTSCPRSAGTFFTGRSLTSLKPSAVSRISVDLFGSERLDAEEVFGLQ